MRVLTKPELSHFSGGSYMADTLLVVLGITLGGVGSYCASDRKDRTSILMGMVIGYFSGIVGSLFHTVIVHTIKGPSPDTDLL